MITKIYVGNLPTNIKEEDLRPVFEEYGTVGEIKLIHDRDTGNFRGFGFIEMSSKDEANVAIENLDGAQIDENVITVNFAREKKEFNRGGGGGGGNNRFRDHDRRDRDRDRRRRY